MISPLLYATWLLCSLGAVVFAASTRRERAFQYTLITVLVAVAIHSFPFQPEPQFLGLLAALVAVLAIAKPRWDWVAAIAAGILLLPLKYSWWFWGIAAASVFAAYRIPTPLRLVREEALVWIAVFGLVVAMTPSVAAGWQAALALNVVDKTNSALAVPNWVLLVVAGSVLIGGLYQGIYKRR